MAEAISREEDSFTCPVCLDLLKDPVTIPCGHNFCMSCIKGCWDQEDQKGVYSCPLCKHTFTLRPVLYKNPLIAEIVEKFRKTRIQAADSALATHGTGDVECDVCTDRKLKAVKSCLECLMSYCETHFKVHNDLNRSRKHTVIDATGQLQERICSRHYKILEIFCRTDQSCICCLCTMNEHKGHDTVTAAAEWTDKQKQLGQTQRRFQQRIQEREKEQQELRKTVEAFKSFHSIRDSPCSKDVPNMTSNQNISFEAVEESVCALKVQLQKPLDGVLKKEVAKISAADTDPQLLVRKEMLPRHMPDVQALCPEPKTREEFLRYSCRFTLDPNTAHRNLHLSEGIRRIEGRFEAQSYPDHPERFDWWPQVLCREGVSGRCYWEVEWSGDWVEDDDISISVSYKTISRKGNGDECGFGSNDQSWSLILSSSSSTFKHDDDETKLPVVASSRIGVYMDHKEGTLAFYSISDTLTLLHRVQTTFTHTLYPGFGMSPRSSVKLL